MLIARTVLETVAKALADAHNVRVVFYGDQCHTDGKTITLPSLPDKVPEDIIMKLRGYLDHEVGHIAFTDFRAYRKLPKSATERFALNAVEDVRIELEMEKIWKGCKVNFERSFDMSIKKIVDPDRKDAKWEDYDAVTKVFLLFIAAARYGFDSELIRKHSVEYIPVLDELADEIEASKSLTSTKEAYEMAVRVLDKIEHIAMPDPPAMLKPTRTKRKSRSETDPGAAGGGGGTVGVDDGAGGDDGKAPTKGGAGAAEKDHSVADEELGGTVYEDTLDEAKEETKDSAESAPATGDEEDAEKIDSGGSEGVKPDKESETGESESEDDETEGSDESETDEDETGESESEDDETEDAGSSEDAESEDPVKKPTSEEVMERLRESLKKEDERSLPDIGKEIAREVRTLEGYRVLTTDKDTFTEWPGTDTGLEEYEEYRKRTHGVVGALKNQLNRLLMSKKRSTWLGGKRHGLINPATLHQAVQQTSDKLYRTRKEGARINTAVSILVDLSGSMGGARMHKATETAVLMAETLNLANIPFEIIGFSGDRTYSGTHGESGDFDRWGSLDMYYFKLFSESLNPLTRRRIGSMRARAQNYDGESVRFAALRLMQRKERKKVLFVLSDGEPCACLCKGSHVLSSHLKQVCKELEAIEDFFLCGFGIQTDAPKRFYRNYVLIDNLADLPKALMEKLYRALV